MSAFAYSQDKVVVIPLGGNKLDCNIAGYWCEPNTNNTCVYDKDGCCFIYGGITCDLVLERCEGTGAYEGLPSHIVSCQVIGSCNAYETTCNKISQTLSN